MKKGRLLICSICLLVILAIVSIASCKAPAPAAPPTQATPETLKIGALLSLTGWFSSYDIENDRELRVFADVLNDKGGVTVNGRQYLFEIVTEDTQSTLDGARSGANKLVFEDNVKFVVETVGLFTLGALPVFEPNKIIHVSDFCTMLPGELGPDTPYKFLGHNSTIGNYMTFFKAVKKLYPDATKYICVYPDDGSLEMTVPLIQSIGASYGFTMVGNVVSYPNETVDYNPIAAKVNAIKGADFILHNGVPPAFGGVIKGVRSLGNNLPYVVCATVQGADLITLAGKDAATNLISNCLTVGSPDNKPLMNDFTSKLEGQYGRSPIIAYCPNCLYLLKQVLEAAQSLDADVIKAKWESMDTLDTLWGEGILSGDKTYGIHHHAIGHPEPIQRTDNGQVYSGGYVAIGAIP